MPLFSSENSVTLATRVPLELAARVHDFVVQSGMSQSAALRLLIERGLDSGLDVDELRMVHYNAKAAAIEELDEVLTEAVERFFGR